MAADQRIRPLTPNERALLSRLMIPVSGHEQFVAQAATARVVDSCSDTDGIALWIPADIPRADLPGAKVLAEGYWYDETAPRRLWFFLWSLDGKLYSIEVIPGEGGRLSDVKNFDSIEAIPITTL